MGCTKPRNEVAVQWLEGVALVEAMGAFVLASMNCRHLLGYARVARSAARRAGARGLCAVSAALALEALAYMASPAFAAGSEARELGVLAVRSALLAASGVIAGLLLRGARRH
jgi:hypothetical protein